MRQIPSLQTTSLLAVLLTCLSLVACEAANIGQADTSYQKETEACRECQAILVECTSTCTDEAQFVACRDQWLECQQVRALGPDECSNPNDIQACDMCRDRFAECQAKGDEEGLCQQQFGVCKAFLITRSDVQALCSESEPNAPLISCDICHEDLALCLSDASEPNAPQLCADKLVQCEAAHELMAGECGTPNGDAGCDLCLAQHEGCSAAGGTSCDEGFSACAANLAADVTCELQGGAGGGGGEGGGGQGTDTCAHDECELGEALDASCSTCAGDVCAQDTWCCDNEWDTLCLELAQGVAACGC